MAYATANQVAAWLGWTAPSAADTEKLTRLSEAATRTIERECSRRFDQVTETRLFDAEVSYLRSEAFPIGDIVSATEVALNTTYTGTTFETLASADWSLTGKRGEFPAYELRVRSTSIRQGQERVRITGTWGWPEVPASIVQACQMEAARLALRDQSPQGSATEGLAGLGTEFEVFGRDLDWYSLVDNYRTATFGYPLGHVAA